MPKDQNSKPKLDDRFIKSIKGKEFVLYSGLLDLAHQIGLQSIKVETLQYPTKDNGLEAICKANVESKNGENFIEIADANPNNVAPLIKQHVLRMAATRAKARALRDMTNIGITCLEELGDFNEIENEKETNCSSKRTTRQNQKTQKKAGNNNGRNNSSNVQKATDKSAPKKEEENQKKDTSTAATSDRPKMSAAQKKAILSLAQRRGLSEEDLTKMSVKTFNLNFEYLDSSSASVFIRDLQQAA